MQYVLDRLNDLLVHFPRFYFSFDFAFSFLFLAPHYIISVPRS